MMQMPGEISLRIFLNGDSVRVAVSMAAIRLKNLQYSEQIFTLFYPITTEIYSLQCFYIVTCMSDYKRGLDW
jgi:hypothetical protein